MTLSRISRELIVEMQGEGDVSDGRVFKPLISPMIDLKNVEKLNGLSERIVAVESLAFLAKQYEFLRDYLEYLVPLNCKTALEQFYAQVSKKNRYIKNIYWIKCYISSL